MAFVPVDRKPVAAERQQPGDEHDVGGRPSVRPAACAALDHRGDDDALMQPAIEGLYGESETYDPAQDAQERGRIYAPDGAILHTLHRCKSPTLGPMVRGDRLYVRRSALHSCTQVNPTVGFSLSAELSTQAIDLGTSRRWATSFISGLE